MRRVYVLFVNKKVLKAASAPGMGKIPVFCDATFRVAPAFFYQVINNCM